MTTQILNGDCLELMKDLEDKSIDLLICDLPYGETNCKWDSVIDLEKFWKEFKRIRKSKRTACIHFCSTKFGFSLIKSWEKGFKMDMVWKKRNKTGGLQSRHRPMRNHEMVYFFYEQAPKYNRDKYHKRINNVKHAKSDTTKEKKTDKVENTILKREKKNFDPVQPASVLQEKYTKEHLDNNRAGAGTNTKSDIYTKEAIKKFQKENGQFEPPNPASVLEEDIYGEDKEKQIKRRNEAYLKSGNVNTFEPVNPASVLEEEDTMFGETKNERNKRYKKNGTGAMNPPNPASVVEEKDLRINEKGKSAHGWDITHMDKPRVAHFDPKLPASVLEEFIEPAEDEPVSMFESKKVFIGKRNHQTEKPQDILEFFLKYWSDENDVILDPTMGSGSTGVACKKLKRNFIGFELDKDIFKVADKRINS